MVETPRFWIGQNIWVVLGGGGIYLVPEHRVYGLICIALGVVGFLYSIKQHQMMRINSSAIWGLALLLTWGGIGYAYYDRHHLAANYDELRAIASLDDQQLEARIYWELLDMHIRQNLNAPEPYLELELGLRNTSVFQLTFDHVEGEVRYHDYPLQGKAELIHSPFIIKHGDGAELLLRQPVTQDGLL